MRYRFENQNQIFDLEDGDIAILPISKWKKGCWAEIPALVYPKDEPVLIEKLKACKEYGLTDIVCENISALAIGRELGLKMHGGLYLNILNAESLSAYAEMGLADACLSMELSFNEAKKIKPSIPVGFVIYGYLPLMKFRACPGDCKLCKGQSVITDRLGEKFTLICRERKYSELLNSVPLYVGDKQIPRCSFTELYFTTETADEAKKIAEIARAGGEFYSRKTGGLYYRELL